MILKTLIHRTLVALLFTLALAAGNVAPARPKGFQSRDTEPGFSREFSEVLDILFPRESLGTYYLVLRYLPAFEPESQIIISENAYNKGVYDVDYYFLSKGSKGIRWQLSDLQSKGASESPHELASHIKVEHTRVTIPQPVISKLMASFFALRFPPKLETGFLTDSTEYDLWYVTFSARNQLFLSVQDVDYGYQVMYPHVRWMNETRRVVMAAAATSK